MATTRTKGRSTVVWLLMGMLLLGLAGFGIENFAGGTTGSIGRVGEVEVSADDYLRGVRADMQSFTAQTGQNMTAEQARAMGVPQRVQARLFTAAALEAEARRLGVSVGDDTVADQIARAPAFQSAGGRFDPALYADVLRREGLTTRAFEHDLRMDEARLILQRAAIGGTAAPAEMRDATVAWLLERRDIGWTELTPAQLAEPVAPPEDETLIAWHQANAERFTAPEIRKITYAWLTPEMLADTVPLDEQALRELYQGRIDEYRQPERRMVERLVYPSEAEAQAAKARLDRHEATFEQLAAERGLQLADIDLGEVAQADLGAAGQAVFALDQPGVVGPFMTDLGPALFSMNAILEPVDIPFEQAEPDLRAEAAADRARRVIEESAPGYEDLLAGGATLEDLVKDTPMKLGHIDWSAKTPSEGIAAYQAFRDHAGTLTDKDFPELFQLDDGGVFALRLDEVVPPALIPFQDIRAEVLADWTAAETRRRLKALAEERKLALDADPAEDAGPATAPAPAAAPAAAQAGAAPVPAGAEPAIAPVPASPGAPVAAGAAAAPAAAISSGPATTFATAAGLERDGAIEGVPGEVVTQAFRLSEPGEIAVAEAGDRVFLVRLDRIIPADLTGEEARAIVAAVERRLTESLQSDLFDYFARGLQQAQGVAINTGALAAANARLQ